MADGDMKRPGVGLIAFGVLLLLIGVGLAFVPRTADSDLGYSLNCGSVFVADSDAVREYLLQQQQRLMDAFEDAGRALAEEMATGNPPRTAGTGESLMDMVFVAPEDLQKRCSDAVETMRAAAGILSLVALFSMFFGLAVWKKCVREFLRRSTQGARMPHWMGTCPEWAQAGLVTFGGLTGALAGVTSGWWRALAVVAMIVLAFVAVLISIARSAESSRQTNELESLRADHKSDTEHLLGNELHSLIQVTAEAVATENRVERCAAAAAARYGLVSAAAHLVGTRGTRANLFRRSADKKSMALEPGKFAGRGLRSTRVFQEGDKTFDLAVVEQVRFVTSARDELVGDERDVPYETFMTYPVSIGPARVHGVLTIDSLKSGDLDEARDTPIMALLSALIAVTYECEKYDNAVI